MPRGGRNTRDDIVRVGMRLFIEQGYDRTTLREIADELQVTKAALYYHFRTKEDIVRAAMADHVQRLEEVVIWLEETPPSQERDEALAQRLTDIFTGPSNTAIRFNQSNPTVLGRKEFGNQQIAMTARLVQAMAGADVTAERVIRAIGAYGALAIGVLSPPGEIGLVPGTPAEREAASRTVTLELLATLRADS